MYYSTTWMLFAAALLFLTSLVLFGTWNTTLALSRTHGFAFRHAAGYALLIAGVVTIVMMGVLAMMVMTPG
ncbi:MAG: hypothetical protein ACYDCO_12520 [Armatimonadota bacterium]